MPSTTSIRGHWHGFSFNPGLRRLHDDVSIGGYGIHAHSGPDGHGAAESVINTLYRRRDFYAAILSDEGGSGYVRHTGQARRVIDATTTTP